MAALLPQFEKARENVEPTPEDKANAQTAHKEVRECLKSDDTLCDQGIDTVLIGSYARQVSIRRMRDVDVFSKLPKLGRGVGPKQLLAAFANVLREGFGAERVEPQDRSIKVEFPSFDLSVDVVPARPSNSHWQIPDRSHQEAWQETNPEVLGNLCTLMNKAHSGLYLPVVKLIRQSRQAHLGERPGGLYFEILTYHAFAGRAVGGSNLSEYYCSALSGVADRLDASISLGLDDPSLPGRLITTRASDADLQKALQKFRQLAKTAAEAQKEDDRCRSAKGFQRILGQNSDNEVVFPMPADCESDGTKRAAPAIVPGDRHVPAGDGRFA
jgi:hypothetical protein